MSARNIPGSDPADFYTIKRQGRFYALYQNGDQLILEEGPQEDRLVCVCVYKKGAEEVRRRLVGKLKGRCSSRYSEPDCETDVAAETDIDDELDTTVPDPADV